jgi:hypothetical protein
LAFDDMDSVRRAFGATKQGAAFGHAKITSKSLLACGLKPLAAPVSTPLAVRLVAATRRPGGDNAASARETVPDTILVRADSAFGKVKRATGSIIEVPCHAVADQVLADLIGGRLPHLPSREFDANAAWPQLAGTTQAPTGPSAPWPQPAQWRAAPPSRAELIQVAGRPPASVRGHSARPVAYPRFCMTTCASAQALVNGNSGGITLFGL